MGMYLVTLVIMISLYQDVWHRICSPLTSGSNSILGRHRLSLHHTNIHHSLVDMHFITGL